MDRYNGEFPKLSISNSFAVDGIVVYHKMEGKVRAYYDYNTKIKLGVSCEHNGVGLSHDEFVEFLNKNLKDTLAKLNS